MSFISFFLQDHVVEPYIFPFFITIGVFNSFRVFVQDIVTIHDFKVVHIGECCWETFCMSATSLQKAMLFCKAVFTSDRYCNPLYCFKQTKLIKAFDETVTKFNG